MAFQSAGGSAITREALDKMRGLTRLKKSKTMKMELDMSLEEKILNGYYRVGSRDHLIDE